MSHSNQVHVMMKPEMARQGDVLIWPIEKAPRKSDIGEVLKEGKRLVLAHGEVTGHAHAIYPEQDVVEGVHEEVKHEPATLYELKNVASYVPTIIEEGMYLHVRERSFLRHEEHETISIAPGHYVVLRQQEYDARKWRTVAD